MCVFIYAKLINISANCYVSPNIIFTTTSVEVSPSFTTGRRAPSCSRPAIRSRSRLRLRRDSGSTTGAAGCALPSIPTSTILVLQAVSDTNRTATDSFPMNSDGSCRPPGRQPSSVPHITRSDSARLDFRLRMCRRGDRTAVGSIFENTNRQ